MLCSNCGSELQNIGETINNEEVYECNSCNTKFNENGDILGDFSQSPSDLDKFVLSEVKRRIYFEMLASMCTREISLDLTESSYIEDYICPDCLYPITAEQLSKTTQCPKCGNEHSGEDIKKFSVLAMMVYRFGITYRGQYEMQVRLDQTEPYDLPALSTGAITSGGAFLLGVLSNAAWDGIKRAYNSRKDQSESSEGYPTLQSPYMYMVMDFLQMVKDNELIKMLTAHVLFTLKISKLASEDGYTVEQYEEEIQQSDTEFSEVPTMDDLPGDLTLNKYREQVDIGDDFEEGEKEKTPSDTEFEWYREHFALKDEMKEKTREELVQMLTKRYVRSIKEALEIYNGSKIHEVIESEIEQVS